MNFTLINKVAGRGLALMTVLTLVVGIVPPATVSAAPISPKCTVVSDASTQVNGSDSFVVTPNDAWATFGGASWIWSSADNTNVAADASETFTKTFNVNGTATVAMLQIAADNGYIVSVNGTQVTDKSAVEMNYAAPASYDIATYLHANAVNTLTVTVNNMGTEANPAGLIFRLDTTGSTCAAIPAPVTNGSLTVQKMIVGSTTAVASDFSFKVTNKADEIAVITNQSFNASGTNVVTLPFGFYDITEAGTLPTGDTVTYSDACSIHNISSDPATQTTCVITNTFAATTTTGTTTATSTDGGTGGATPTPKVCIAPNLLSNPSFEADSASDGTAFGSGFYKVFSSITGWTSTAGFELWNNIYGGAKDGEQNAELDVAAPTTITQDIPTVVGNEYKVSFAFGARPSTNAADNSLQVLVNGVAVGTTSADGSSDETINWTNHSFAFTATAATSTIAFQDLGTANGVGTLLDNTAVCLTQNNSAVTPGGNTYEIYGTLWTDSDADGAIQDTEGRDAGWTVTAVNASNSAMVYTSTTDVNGRYSLNVPAGTWTIAEQLPAGWVQLSPTSTTYTVTVPTPVEVVPETPIMTLINMIVPTAFAATLGSFGPYNFGNEEEPVATLRHHHHVTSSTPAPQVLGASTSTDPVGTVLGAATTTLPVGAPNTGAGGTSPLVINFPVLSAIMGFRVTTRKTK